MAKPSIFSKDYERKMKKRKTYKKIGVTICVLAIIILLGLYKSNGIWNKLVNSDTSTIETPKKETATAKEIVDKTATKQTKDSTSKSDTNSTDNTKAKVNDTNKVTEQTYNVQMANNQIAQVHYVETNGKRQLKDVKTSTGAPLVYDVSPNGNGLLIYDGTTQNTYYSTINDGASRDITKQSYVSTINQTYTKDSVLQRNPIYDWCSSPKFIDDTTIVYVSQLPWLQRTTKHIWAYNINTNAYTSLTSASGEDVSIGNRINTGIQVTCDNQTFTLGEDLSIKN